MKHLSNDLASNLTGDDKDQQASTASRHIQQTIYAIEGVSDTQQPTRSYLNQFYSYFWIIGCICCSM